MGFGQFSLVMLNLRCLEDIQESKGRSAFESRIQEADGSHMVAEAGAVDVTTQGEMWRERSTEEHLPALETEVECPER